ncbi:glycosyltransferase [Infirmifilum sp. NZ]|uniref:glycosyltransferase n=1 Tax=Infirmifilum sp. NZ TaxID=2926850 RepID=UPI00279C9206|nr:glycosyltransferase [Infirmifilum sp. NZ]UNQ73147.1 glycosyltransferase [Infirmifilum sp. NZ]
MRGTNILLVPPNDLINNALPNRLYHLARHWAERHSIYLLRYPSYPISTSIERFLRRTDILPTAKPAGNPGTYYLKNAKALYEALKKTLEREPVEVIVHANILPSTFAVRLARRQGVKTVFDYLDHYPESASAYYRNRLAKKLVHTAVYAITIYNLRNSDEVVTVSHALKQLVDKHARRPAHLIPNGVDTKLFKPTPKETARRELALENHDPILLYYGSIAEWIDWQALLQLTARLKPRHPKALLLLVGKTYGHLDLEIKQKARSLGVEDNVKLVPPQPQEKIPTYISAADIVYAPFKNIQMNLGTPVKIFESLSCSRPVIAADLYEFKLWFKDFLLYYRDINDLESLTLQIIDNYEEYRSLVEKAREYVEINFDWKILAQRYEEVFL